jgi:transposase-like protein
MVQKSKVPIRKKLKIVGAYLSGDKRLTRMASSCGVCHSTIQEWVRLFETFGVEGLTPASKRLDFSAEVKNDAVLAYFDGEGSFADLARKYKIRCRETLRRWVMQYKKHGRFTTSRKEREPNMHKGRTTTLKERMEIVNDCINNGLSYSDAAVKYKVSYQQLYSWVQKYSESGEEGLADRRGKRKPESEMNEVEQLRAQLKRQEAENLRLRMENDFLKKLKELERRAAGA